LSTGFDEYEYVIDQAVEMVDEGRMSAEEASAWLMPRVPTSVVADFNDVYGVNAPMAEDFAAEMRRVLERDAPVAYVPPVAPVVDYASQQILSGMRAGLDNPAQQEAVASAWAEAERVQKGLARLQGALNMAKSTNPWAAKSGPEIAKAIAEHVNGAGGVPATDEEAVGMVQHHTRAAAASDAAIKHAKRLAEEDLSNFRMVRRSRAMGAPVKTRAEYAAEEEEYLRERTVAHLESQRVQSAAAELIQTPAEKAENEKQRTAALWAQNKARGDDFVNLERSIHGRPTLADEMRTGQSSAPLIQWGGDAEKKSFADASREAETPAAPVIPAGEPETA
jgi:hypothetical protein